jgi:hypothetical protein
MLLVLVPWPPRRYLRARWVGWLLLGAASFVVGIAGTIRATRLLSTRGVRPWAAAVPLACAIAAGVTAWTMI